MQILEKADYSKQHIVEYDKSLPPLGESSIRVQSSIISITANNITYARFGDVPGFNFFGAHPLPFQDGLYSDSSKYGRISAWGVGTVIESTADFVPVGKQVWGYLPIASLPVDKKVEPTKVKDVIMEITDYRQPLLPIYNRFFILDKTHAENQKLQAYSALMKVLFETAYALNRVSFAWDPQITPVNPLGLHPPPNLDTWGKQQANLRGSTVIIMPASSKTAFAFAYMTRFIRPKNEQPRAVIGVSSASSQNFTEDTKLYDKVPLYQTAEAEPSHLAQELGIATTDKVVIVDFGAREGFKDLWRSKLDAISNDVLFIRVASAIPQRTGVQEDPGNRARENATLAPNTYPSNVSPQRDAGMQMYGEAEYFADLSTEFDRFLEHDSVKTLQLTWGNGMKGPEGVEGGWDRICSGKLSAAEGLVYRLP